MARPKNFFGTPLFLIISLCLLEGQTSLTLSPLRTELAVSPGKTKKQALRLGNGLSRSVKIRAGVESWGLEEDGTLLFYPPGDSPYSRQDWITLDASEFVLGPGENRSVSFTLSVPVGTAPGHYWAALTFETVDSGNPEKQSGSMMIQGKMMAAVFVMVGEAVAAGEIKDMSLSEREGEKAILICFKNSGRVIFMTSGRLEIKDGRGKKVLSQELPEEMVLPSGERKLKVALEKDIPPGTYTALCSVKLPSRKTIEFRQNLNIQ